METSPREVTVFWGASRNAPPHVCDVCPFVILVQDSVTGSVALFFNHCCSGGKLRLGTRHFCTCMWGLRYGAHIETRTCGPGLRVGDVVVVRIVCLGKWV